MIWNWFRKKKKSNTTEAKEADNWEQQSNNPDVEQEEK